MIYKLNIDAFVATPETSEAMEQAREHRDLAKSRLNVMQGGLPAAVAYYSDNRTPQLIIVEETGDDHAMMEHLASLAEVCEPGTKVVIIGTVNDISVYRHLIGQGVSEYLVAPVTAREIVDAIVTIFADPTQPTRGRMIAVIGARGGVGSSTVAHNLAWSIAQSVDEDTILVDLDVPFGTSGLAFNMDSKQTIGDALAQPERIDMVLLERFLVKHDERLQVLMSAGDLRVPPDMDIEAVDKVLDQVRQMAAFVVVDLPHLWAPWVDFTLKSADEMVIVAQPDLANLRDCKNLVEIVGAKRGEGNAPRIVLNKMDAHKRTQLSPKDFEETLRVAPTLSVAFEPNVFGAAANNGQMVGEASKSSKPAENFKQLALQLTGRQAVQAKKHPSLLGWLKVDMKSKKRK